MGNATEQSAKDEVEANIVGIAEAVNAMDLEKYGKLITADFVNMNEDLHGEMTSTTGRQARLDVLRTFFDKSPYATKATMKPSVIHIHGDRAFACVDGTLQLVPKDGTDLRGFTLTLDLYLFFLKEKEHGWLSERSMGIERTRTDD